MSTSTHAPSFFPFIWLPGMSFVPVQGTEVEVRVDGQARTIPRPTLPERTRHRPPLPRNTDGTSAIRSDVVVLIPVYR